MASQVQEVRSRDAYSGEKREQLRDGFGVYNYDNKFFRYEGEWKSGKKQGHGKFSMADGGYYEGEFEDGEITGHGFRLFPATNNTYSGEFCMGELHGQGVMKYGNGSVYEGEWHMNKRQGYGMFRSTENEVYQGYLHDHRKHGEGTQIYNNGDRYDGDWVMDKRQGHGELRCNDGTIYDGQWRGDCFNGQGMLSHASGMVYEGLFINGRPSRVACQLKIKCESPLEVIQGMPFALDVECIDEDGEVVEDQGRQIQITAGFQNYSLNVEDEKVAESSTTTLFEAIEDVAEKPLPTPFGYDIVSYPITDQFPQDELLTEATSLSMVNRSKSDMGDGSVIQETETDKDTNARIEQRTESPSLQESITISETVTAPDTQLATEESFLPPPVSSSRSEKGKAHFESLVLTAAPPLFRPFINMEEEERSKKRKGTKKESKKDSDDESSRPATRVKKDRTLGDERFARPGEYVVMAQDVTTPPFYGEALESAFILVKVILPKKPVRKVGAKKERGPRWDTSKHIAHSMARGHSMAAKEDIVLHT